MLVRKFPKDAVVREKKTVVDVPLNAHLVKKLREMAKDDRVKRTDFLIHLIDREWIRRQERVSQ